MAQYENEARTPKIDLVKDMAQIFEVSPRAINVPEIDTYIGLMHTFFALEDMYGFRIDSKDHRFCLRFESTGGRDHLAIQVCLSSWMEKYKELLDEKISQDEYDDWRYNFPVDGPNIAYADIFTLAEQEKIKEKLNQELDEE